MGGLSAGDAGQGVEVVVVGGAQDRHRLRVGADHVGHVQEGESHLGGDVVRDRERQGVGGVLLPQPRTQVLVEPERGVHRGREDPVAAWVEQQPTQLLEVRDDEVEEVRPVVGADVPRHGGQRVPAVRHQFLDEGRVGVEEVGDGCRGGRAVGGCGADVAAVDDGAQGVPDQRIVASQGVQEAVAGG